MFPSFLTSPGAPPENPIKPLENPLKPYRNSQKKAPSLCPGPPPSRSPRASAAPRAWHSPAAAPPPGPRRSLGGALGGVVFYRGFIGFYRVF